GGADLMRDTQSWRAEAVDELRGAVGCAVEDVDTCGARFEQGPGRGARGTAGTEQQDADAGRTADQRRGGDVHAFHVGVIAVNHTILRPEGIAGAGANDGLARPVDGRAGACLVRNSDVAATTCLCDGAHDRGDVSLGTTEHDVDGVEAVFGEGRV